MRKSFSVIIPVFNESLIINHSIEQVYRTGSEFDIEVIVVDGNVSGNTINAIANNEVVRISTTRGRGTQMNKGASIARGDILVFLHADTELPEGAFQAISSLLDSDEYVGGAFHLGIKSDRWIFRIIEKAVSIRTRLTRIPYGDQVIFIKKSHFKKMQGFPEISLMEDVAFMKSLKKNGFKIGIIPLKVLTSARRWEQEGVLFCTLRNWILITLFFLGVNPEKLEQFYYRHTQR